MAGSARGSFPILRLGYGRGALWAAAIALLIGSRLLVTRGPRGSGQIQPLSSVRKQAASAGAIPVPSIARSPGERSGLKPQDRSQTARRPSTEPADTAMVEVQRAQSRTYGQTNASAKLTTAAAQWSFQWINPGPQNLVHPDGSLVSGKLQAFAWAASQPQVMYTGGGNGAGIQGGKSDVAAPERQFPPLIVGRRVFTSCPAKQDRAPGFGKDRVRCGGHRALPVIDVQNNRF